MNGVRLGDWMCPSGNNLVAVYCAVSALIARVHEYTERGGGGATLVLTQ